MYVCIHCVCGRGGGVKQSLDSPRGFREVEAPRFHLKIKVVRSAYAPTAFTHQEIFLVRISVGG